MTKINIKFMSDNAIDTLKSNIDYVTEQLIANPKDSSWLRSFIPDEIFITKKYEIEDFSLEIPTDKKDRETDIRNSILLYETLNHLPSYVLSDERFWAWINFEKGYEAALKLMPPDDGKAVFKDHWLFTQGNRRGVFFGVLSRCYYRVALTVDPSLEDPYEYSKFAIEKPRRFRELSWRTFSSEKTVVLGSLKAIKRVVEETGVKEKPKFYDELAKALSRKGGMMLLDIMDEKDLEQFVYEEYKMYIA